MKQNLKWTIMDHVWSSRIWVGTLVLMILAGIAIACFTNSDNDPIDTLAYDDFLSVKELYPFALKKALAWHQDASLEWVSGDITQTAVFTCFSFENESDPEVGLNVYMFEKDRTVKIETEEINTPYHTIIPVSIEPDQLSVDSIDALRIALAAGGRAFLQNHSLTRVHFQLRYDFNWEPLKVLWRVYFDNFPVSHLDIFIHPDTGEVLRVEQNWKALDSLRLPTDHHDSLRHPTGVIRINIERISKKIQACMGRTRYSLCLPIPAGEFENLIPCMSHGISSLLKSG